MKKTAVITLAHGSRLEEANREVIKLAETLMEKAAEGLRIFPAFLQFGKPSLEDSLEKAVVEGYPEVIVAPLFLTSGVHITRDIPEILSKMQERYPQVRLQQCHHLGCDSRLVPLIWERVEECRSNSSR